MVYRPLADPDADLTELLAREFNVEFLRARNAARKLSFNDFSQYYGVLEALVGEDTAKDVVKNGSFLDYKNGCIDEYFRLIRLTKKDKFNQNPCIFYSLDSLKDYLNKNQNHPILNVSNLDLSRNKLFHLDDKKSFLYLSSLIETGYLIVSTNEHWCKSRTNTGPRGLNILRRISFQLATSFSDLGLGRPNCDINYGQGKLSVNSQTREQLKNIRDNLLKK